jgi:hypothetical protein
MSSGDRKLTKATPAMARVVWEAQRRPSARTVARALTLTGKPVHHVTIARWKVQGWRSVSFDHPLEIARGQIEGVAPLVTGNPETTIQALIDDPAHNYFDGLSDGEVMRRAAREVAIATALIWKAIKDRITKSDFDILELTPALSALGHSMHALPAAFEQAIDLNEAEQRKKGMRT